MKNRIRTFVESEFRSLGTDVFVRVIAGGYSEKRRARYDLNRVKNIFSAEEMIFSRFDPKSEISCLNNNLGVWQNASADVSRLAKRALHYNRISGGMYDPRVIGILENIGYDADFRKKDFSKMKDPPKFSAAKGKLMNDLKVGEGKIFFSCRMDFSGIAKGYIVDCAAKYLKSRGWKNFLVDAGGDMFANGKNEAGKKWKTAVEGAPEEKMMLEVSGKGIATSGISRKKWRIKGKKFHHLVNPKDPNNYSYELRTVSVIAQDTENADGRAKALVLMGKKKGLEFATVRKIAAVFLDSKGNVLLSPGAKKYSSIRN